MQRILRAGAARPRSGRIACCLVLEPDRASREELVGLVRDAGARAVAVSSPAAARAAAAWTDVQLVVVGPGLPEVDGPAARAALPTGAATCAVVRVCADGATIAGAADDDVPEGPAVGATLRAWVRACATIARPPAAADALATVPDALIVVDVPEHGGESFRIVGANPAGERLLGLPGGAGGMMLGARGSGRELRPLVALCTTVANSGVPHEVDLPLDGRWYAFRVLPTGRGGLAVTARDVTERRREDARRRSLAAIADAIAHGTRLPALHPLVADAVAGCLEVGLAAIGQVDDEGMRVLAVNRGAPMRLAGPPAPEASALAAAGRTARPVRVRFTAGLGADWHGHGPLEEVAVPILTDSRPWGAVMVAHGERGVPGDAERLLEPVAHLVSVAVGHDRVRSELETRASTDALTGLPNRRAFHERLDQEMGRARRHDRPMALAVLDLDHFKRINDTHGHATGDAVLREAAERIRSEARDSDQIARIGGEEFAWIMPESDASRARPAVERALRRLASHPFPAVGTVTASAGLCDMQAAADAAALFALADAALYRAKQDGRDRVVVHTEGGAAHGPGDAPTDAAARPRRVAAIVARVAEQLGWSATQVEELRGAVLRLEAAPDRDAHLVWGALADERWDHHGGRPSDPARLLAAARAWDRLTCPPPHGHGLPRAAARARLDALAGDALCPDAVRRLLDLEAGGAL